MSDKSAKFELYLPSADANSEHSKAPLRKYATRLEPGQTQYLLRHNFGTRDVIVQSRIAENIREGGISILDENTVRIAFGGPLHEPMDVVIIG